MRRRPTVSRSVTQLEVSKQRHLDCFHHSPTTFPSPSNASLPSKALLPLRKPRLSQPAAGLLLHDKPRLPVADEQRLSALHCSGDEGLAPIGSVMGSSSLSTLLLLPGAPPPVSEKCDCGESVQRPGEPDLDPPPSPHWFCSEAGSPLISALREAGRGSTEDRFGNISRDCSSLKLHLASIP